MDIQHILSYIPPSDLDYQDWVNVGMALKLEGYDCSVWDEWSRADSRYHAGECARKWNSFNGSASPVTVGTLVQMAKDRGMPVHESRELSWDDEISFEGDGSILSTGEGEPIREPDNWNPVQELITYLELLFEPSDNVGYVTDTWEKNEDGKIKYLPTKGACDRTAGELIDLLRRYNDIGAVFGDCNPQAGAWIRFNPLDGKGVKNDNVTEYRYALVESDCMPIEQQNALIRELELPVAVLVYSGGKSVHAIVRVDAENYDEYRRRVDYLYNVCRKNGLEIDRQNRNPSRLSRMPGVTRGDKKQYIIDTHIGKRDWAEWRDWIESMNDDLPEFENLADYFDNPPPLAPPLIDGVLRQGHKMLIAGPPKAGKSFALIELAIAIAEGVPWLGFNCAQGKVMYVNLELDKASCYRRFIDVYKAMGVSPENVRSIDIWNLRGLSVPMDKLAPMLIRRAAKKGFIAVIIDPIYKVLTGDENSAEQMARFCNQFDKVCTELGCSVIYCHHHSKGSQGGKRSMDRASGSGVFSRDPDALLDLTELEITESLFIQQENAEICEAAKGWISRFHKLDEVCSQDDMLSAKAMVEIARKTLTDRSFMLMMQDVDKAKKAVRARRAWRVEGTLREFKALDPVDLWFSYPVHILDESGVLGDCEFDGDRNSKNSPYGKNFSKKKSKEEKKEERKESIEELFNACNVDGNVTVTDLVEYSGKTEMTIRKHLKEHGGFVVKGGFVSLKEE
ncbi:MAG: AAA family ATPase [Ruminococcus sp.]|nr:AAA family ATPase [Ruminococcus sp.]MBQ4171647.1 AAA family ATPase [Ruminococcus sp.]